MTHHGNHMKRLFDRIAPWLSALIVVLIFGVIVAHVSAAEPQKPPDIVFPDFTPREDPKPPLPIPSVPVVKPGEMYVIVGKVAVEVIPEDAASVDTDTGPVKIRGLFFNGGGKRESKTFDGFVSIVEPNATASGRVKLRLWSSGNPIPTFTDHFIDIGAGPRPPPEPAPEPDPDPTPTAKKLGIVTIDVAADRAKNLPLARLLTDIAYWDTLRAAGHKVWLMDKSNAQARQYDDLAAKNGYPLTVFYDGAVTPPRMLGTAKTPNTKAEFDALLKQFTGGK